MIRILLTKFFCANIVKFLFSSFKNYFLFTGRRSAVHLSLPLPRQVDLGVHESRRRPVLVRNQVSGSIFGRVFA